jgi:hypothetical protein
MTDRQATTLDFPFGSRMSSVFANAREITSCELVSPPDTQKDKAEAFVLRFINSSPQGVHKDAIEAVSAIKLPRLSRILDRLFRAGQIMVDYGGVYRPTGLPSQK